MIRPLWVWGPAIAQMAAIFYASSLPDISTLPGGVSDKVAHFIGYALLGALMLRAVSGARVSGATPKAALWAFVATTFYGVTDEGHQLFVQGRTAAFDDLIADAVGAAAAVAFCWMVTRMVRRRRVERGEV